MTLQVQYIEQPSLHLIMALCSIAVLEFAILEAGIFISILKHSLDLGIMSCRNIILQIKTVSTLGFE